MRWIRLILLWLGLLAAPAAGQATQTFAERLAASQSTKRQLDIAAIRATASTKVFYVRTTGADANNGSSPATAFRTVQKAINTVNSPGSVIVVGPGTYSESLTFTSGTRSGSSNSPNTIFADTTAALTGGTAGGVVISGGTNGLTMSSCNHWTFKWLKFSGQSQGNVYILGSSSTTPTASGLTFDGCEFVVTPYYGLLAYYVGNITVNDCTFTRGSTSGFSAYVCTTGATSLKLTANRLNRTGSGYDSTRFKDGVLGFFSGDDDHDNYGGSSGYSAICYGIIGMAYGSTRTTVTIENNIVTDAFLGIYAYGYGAAHTLNVRSNLAVSCYYGLYAYGYNGTGGVIANNMTGNCFLGSYTYLPTGRIQGHMEWGIKYLTQYPQYALAYTTTYRNVAAVVGYIADQTPSFVNAANGDFTLAAGSAGIDAGYDAYAPTLDAAGVTRPVDGNGDGTALCDFGPVEGLVSRLLRVVRWRPTPAEE